MIKVVDDELCLSVRMNWPIVFGAGGVTKVNTTLAGEQIVLQRIVNSFCLLKMLFEKIAC